MIILSCGMKLLMLSSSWNEYTFFPAATHVLHLIQYHTLVHQLTRCISLLLPTVYKIVFLLLGLGPPTSLVTHCMHPADTAEDLIGRTSPDGCILFLLSTSGESQCSIQTLKLPDQPDMRPTPMGCHRDGMFEATAHVKRPGEAALDATVTGCSKLQHM